MKEPLVSVVVPTRNSEKTIGACLDSIKNQSYPNIEIIVVDNHSTDRTCDVARRYTEKVFLTGPERSAQRNYGAALAGGEYLLFPDSDMVLTEDVVRDCVDLVRESPGVAAVVIPEESFGEGFWSDCRRLERLFYKGVDWLEASRFFNRDVFLEMGGYDLRNTGTEDFDLPQRIKARHGAGSTSRISSLIYHNEQRRTLVEACRTNYYYGHALDAYLSVEANRGNFRKQQSVLQRYSLYFSDPRMLLRNPALGFGVLFMKLCEFGAWGTGFLTAKVKAILSRNVRRSEPGGSEKIRILCLLWHSSYGVITAGGFKRTFEIFKRAGDEVEILAIDNSPTFLSGLDKDNVTVIEYNFPKFFAWLEQEYFLFERLLEWMLTPIYILFISLRLLARGERFDVVLVPSSEIIPTLMAGVVARFLFGARLVLTNMNIELFSPLVKRAVAWLHNRSHLVITISNDLSEKLRQSGVRVPVVITGVGLDTDYIADVLEGGEFDKEYDAVFVGRHILAKGVVDLIEAWNVVTNTFPDARLLMMGSCDPDHGAIINRKIAEYGLNANVVIMGTVDEKDKFHLIKKSKMCLFPSYVEGWGIVPLEGLACGLPAIVYDLAVYEENAKPCKAVFTVPVGDWRAMAEKAVELLEGDAYLELEVAAQTYCGGPGWNEVASSDFKAMEETLRR